MTDPLVVPAGTTPVAAQLGDGLVVDNDAVATANGSLAARLRAKRAQLENRERLLYVPPRDIWGQDLAIKVRSIKLEENMPNVRLISEATTQVMYRDDNTGELVPIDRGWAGLGELMGVAGEGVTLGQIIKAVCKTDEIVLTLAEEVLAFILGRSSKIEQVLGE